MWEWGAITQRRHLSALTVPLRLKPLPLRSLRLCGYFQFAWFKNGGKKIDRSESKIYTLPQSSQRGQENTERSL